MIPIAARVHLGASSALGFNRSWEGYVLQKRAGPQVDIDHGQPRGCGSSPGLKTVMNNASYGLVGHHRSSIVCRPSSIVGHHGSSIDRYKEPAGQHQGYLDSIAKNSKPILLYTVSGIVLKFRVWVIRMRCTRGLSTQEAQAKGA